MVDLWRDFWIREIGTGQQVAQLHERYMTMMMMMMMMIIIIIIIIYLTTIEPSPSGSGYYACT